MRGDDRMISTLSSEELTWLGASIEFGLDPNDKEAVPKKSLKVSQSNRPPPPSAIPKVVSRSRSTASPTTAICSTSATQLPVSVPARRTRSPPTAFSYPHRPHTQPVTQSQPRICHSYTPNNIHHRYQQHQQTRSQIRPRAPSSSKTVPSIPKLDFVPLDSLQEHSETESPRSGVELHLEGQSLFGCRDDGVNKFEPLRHNGRANGMNDNQSSSSSPVHLRCVVIPPTPGSTPNSVTPTTPLALAPSSDVGSTPTSNSPTKLYTPRSFMMERASSTASASPSTPTRTRFYPPHSLPSPSHVLPSPISPAALISMSASSSSTSLASSTSTPSKIPTQSQWIYRKPKSPPRPAGLGSTASIFGSTSTLSTTASHQQQQQVPSLPTQSNTWSNGDTGSQNSCGTSNSACLTSGNGGANGHSVNRDRPRQNVATNSNPMSASIPVPGNGGQEQKRQPQKSPFLKGPTRNTGNSGFGNVKSGGVLGNGVGSTGSRTLTRPKTITTMTEIGTPSSSNGSKPQSSPLNHTRSNPQPVSPSSGSATAPTSSSAPSTPSSTSSSNMFWSSLLRPRTKSERTVPLLNLKNQPSIQTLQTSSNSGSSPVSGSFRGGLFAFRGSTPATPTKESTENKEDGDAKDKEEVEKRGNPLISSPKSIQHMRTPSITSNGSSASSSSSSRPHTPNSASLGHGFGLGQKHARSQSEPNPPRTPHSFSTFPNSRFAHKKSTPKSILSRSSSLSTKQSCSSSPPCHSVSPMANTAVSSSLAMSMSTTSSSSSTNGKSVKFVDMPTVHYASWDPEFDLEVVESVDEEASQEDDNSQKDIDEERELDLDDMREFGAQASFRNGRDQGYRDVPSVSSTSSSPSSNTFGSSSDVVGATEVLAPSGPVAAAAKGLKRLISLTRRQSAGRRKAGTSTSAGSSLDPKASAAAPTTSTKATSIPQRERESLPTLPSAGSGPTTRTPTSSTSSTLSSISNPSSPNARPSISGPFALGTVPIPTRQDAPYGSAIVGGSLPSSFDNTLHSRYSAARSTTDSIKSGHSQTTSKRQGAAGAPLNSTSGAHRRPPSSRHHHPHLHNHHHSQASSSVTSFPGSVATSFATAFGGLSRGERSEGGTTSSMLRAMPSLESFRSARSAGTRSVRSLGSVISTSSLFKGWFGRLGATNIPPNAGVATTDVNND